MTSDKWVFYRGHNGFSVKDVLAFFANKPFKLSTAENWVLAEHAETGVTVSLDKGPWVQTRVREWAEAYGTDEGQRRALEQCDRSMYIFYNPYPVSDEVIEIVTNLEIDLASAVDGYLFDPRFDTFA